MLTGECTDSWSCCACTGEVSGSWFPFMFYGSTYFAGRLCWCTGEMMQVSPSAVLLILIFPFTRLFVVLDSKVIMVITHPLLSRLYGKDT